MLTRQELLLLQHLSQYVTEQKRNIVDQVLNNRTRYVTVVMEDIFQSQNASAVVRTCECFGLQDIHIIENEGSYKVNRGVLKGANKWINLMRYKSKDENNTAACYAVLREKGYTIVATDPDPVHTSIQEINLDRPLALVFGNELNGLSAYARQSCDTTVHIPIYGFTESYNISVSAAICLSTLDQKLRSSNRLFGLTEDEKQELKLSWYKKIVRKSDIIEREFLRTIS